jgi:hypothetical protein
MRIKKFSSMGGKIVMAIVFASAIGGIYIASAFGQGYNDRRGYNTQGQYQQQGRYQQGRYEYGQYVYVHGRRVYQPRTYYHPQPVYAPPPVAYYPAPSPGISLVFPIIIR